MIAMTTANSSSLLRRVSLGIARTRRRRPLPRLGENREGTGCGAAGKAGGVAHRQRDRNARLASTAWCAPARPNSLPSSPICQSWVSACPSGSPRGGAVEQDRVIGAADPCLAVAAAIGHRRRIDHHGHGVGGCGAVRAGIVDRRSATPVYVPGVSIDVARSRPVRRRPVAEIPVVCADGAVEIAGRAERRSAPYRPGRPAGQGRPRRRAAG